MTTLAKDSQRVQSLYLIKSEKPERVRRTHLPGRVLYIVNDLFGFGESVRQFFDEEH